MPAAFAYLAKCQQSASDLVKAPKRPASLTLILLSSMSISNPSHLLISRNPRSPAHPQLAPTLTARHTPSTSFPPNLNILGPWPSSSDVPIRSAGVDSVDDASVRVQEQAEEEEEVIVVHPTFHRDAAMPGRVKVMVSRYEFWCHKEILWFASPFFQSLLEGNWAETNRLPSVVSSATPSRRNSWTTSSPTDTDLQALQPVPESLETSPSAPTDPGNEAGTEVEDEDNEDEIGRKGSIYLDANEDGPSVAEILQELRRLPDQPSCDQYTSPVASSPNTVEPELRSPSTPALLHLPVPQPAPPAMTPSTQTHTQARSSSTSTNRNRRSRSGVRHSFSSAIRVSARAGGEADQHGGRADAVVELHEESAAAFQDFLFWCYPHLECKVTWTNVEDLLPLSLKLLTPALQKLCEHFLLTHASGRPVMALMLAERHGHAELYREASRFVLDQPTWDKEEMQTLDEQTQLKLSQRRNWFLERLLKLGTIDVKREYTCRPDCPDPARCQATLDEKWRQAHNAVCRYGPPQPSVAFRCLRQLEIFPTNPSLVMPHPLCQRAAQSWVTNLFDRMFQPKIVSNPFNPGTVKYWLWISLV